MLDTRTPVAILFADICGSTELFESTTDEAALASVGACLDEMTSIAGKLGAEIIRSKGDDLLCIFEHGADALDAATSMLDKEFDGGVQIHAGIHFGLVVRGRGDIFGDAVNTAARMLSLANPDELLVTEALYEQLNPIDKRMLHLIEERVVKGKIEPIKIYSLVGVEGVKTQFFIENANRHTVNASSLGVDYDENFRIVLDCQGQTIICTERGGEVSMGRSSGCDIVLSEPCVSREHASISVRQGRAVLVDRSSTGTFITANGENPILVRRETVPLLGNGLLSLGRSPRAEYDNLIHFRSQSSEPES